MIRTQIQLTEDQVRALKGLAARSGLSMAELIHRSLDRLLHSAGTIDRERRRRAVAVAGRFRSGRPDISQEHDRYLAEN